MSNAARSALLIPLDKLNNMNIVFMGTPEFAAVCLKKLLLSHHGVLAVVTVPDKPQGRGLKVQASPVKKVALEHRLEILQPVLLVEPAFINRLQNFHADVFVVVAFRILPPAVFSIPIKGTVNVHASLLPKYRGAAPINWAIINGDSETGVTTMFIEQKVDAGKILLQAKMPIAPDMNAGDLHDILATLGSELLIKTLKLIEDDRIEALPQNEIQVTKAPKIKKDDCHLTFNRTALTVHNWIRGLSPYPGAFCFYQNKLLKIFSTKIAETNEKAAEPGTIVKIKKNSFVVACAAGAIEIFEVQPEGRKRMMAADFFNGYPIALGEKLK